MQRFKIVVIGAGETGTPLLKQLLGASFVDLLGVADLDPASPGIALAESRGVRVTSDFNDLVALGEQVDIIIDATGQPSVRDALRNQLQASGNRHTLIMHEMISLLLMSLSAGRLVESKHDALDYA